MSYYIAWQKSSHSSLPVHGWCHLLIVIELIPLSLKSTNIIRIYLISPIRIKGAEASWIPPVKPPRSSGSFFVFISVNIPKKFQRLGFLRDGLLGVVSNSENIQTSHPNPSRLSLPWNTTSLVQTSLNSWNSSILCSWKWIGYLAREPRNTSSLLHQSSLPTKSQGTYILKSCFSKFTVCMKLAGILLTYGFYSVDWGKTWDSAFLTSS